jgi:microcystin-dependent protein
MADPFIGEIRMFAGNFAPKNWAFCDGQLIAISQNQALYSVIGMQYGGDGRTTFALPNLKDRVPMGNGNGPGLTPKSLGQFGGSMNAPLAENQIPNHTHTLNVNTVDADVVDPLASVPAKGVGQKVGPRSYPLNLYNEDPASVTMALETVQDTGGGQGHINIQPYLCVMFIICMVGVYPARQ